MYFFGATCGPFFFLHLDGEPLAPEMRNPSGSKPSGSKLIQMEGILRCVRSSLPGVLEVEHFLGLDHLVVNGKFGCFFMGLGGGG